VAYRVSPLDEVEPWHSATPRLLFAEKNTALECS